MRCWLKQGSNVRRYGSIIAFVVGLLVTSTLLVSLALLLSITAGSMIASVWMYFLM